MLNIPIFLPSDDNYAPYLATCMASILSNTKSFINFYILDGGITETNRKRIENLINKFNNFTIEFLKIDVEKQFQGFSLPERINLSTYMRFLIPNLKPNLGKVIYIDSDTINLNDIADLYNENLENYALGACWNEGRKYYCQDSKELMELSENYKYFNAGVLLIDIQKWKQDNIVQKLFDIEKKYREKVLHADETLLNKYFDNNYKIIDIKYNFTQWDYSFNKVPDKIYTRHYITKLKPWMITPNKKTTLYHNISDFWHYAKMTDFYDEMLENTLPETEQNKLLQQMQLENLVSKTRIKMGKNK